MSAAYFMLDSDGKPIPVAEADWALWMFKHDIRRLVDKTVICESPMVVVLTVFTGRDVDFTGTGKPNVYGTMVSRDGKGDEIAVYPSLDEAIAGHARAVAAAAVAAAKIGAAKAQPRLADNLFDLDGGVLDSGGEDAS